MDGIPVVIEAHGRSDPGLLREHNEDSFVVAHLRRTMAIEQCSLDIGPEVEGNLQATMLLVADGMGGESAGDRASQMAVQTYIEYVVNLMPWFYRLDHKHGGDLVSVLRDGVARCEAEIQAYQQAEPNRGRMGTTMTLAWVLWPNLYVVHAGDSRCYLLRKGTLRQLTRDHTVAQLMVDQGTHKELDDEQYGHVLWNAVGADAQTPVKPQVGKHELEFGDYLLLCSDGLYGTVEEEKIRQLLLAPASAREATKQLIQAALDGGGEDNVTAIVARFGAAGSSDDETTIEEALIGDDEPTIMT